jgi:uncharacterized coiled-coil protein SlyX
MCGCGQLQPIVVTVDLTAVLARLDQLEATMANEAEQLNALSAKIDDVISDVRAALAILTAERDNLGTEGQVALDALTAKVDAFDAEVGDADGSDVPPPVEP